MVGIRDVAENVEPVGDANGLTEAPELVFGRPLPVVGLVNVWFAEEE
jgi:hypothetical protein